MGGEIVPSWVCERRFSTFSPLFLLSFALSRSPMLIALATATESRRESGQRGKPPRLFQIGTRFPFWNPPHRPSRSNQEVRKGSRQKSPICSRLVLWEFPSGHQVDILPADFTVPSHSTEVAPIPVNACCQRGFAWLLPASPAHRLLSAGSRGSLREGVAICASARFLAEFPSKSSAKPRLHLSNPRPFQFGTEGEPARISAAPRKGTRGIKLLPPGTAS
jgi:hypothetical protein